MKPLTGLELTPALVDHGNGPMPVPDCPTCSASGKHCVRPSGDLSERWHSAREDVLARQCRCETHCARWLKARVEQRRDLERQDQPSLFEVAADRAEAQGTSA